MRNSTTLQQAVILTLEDFEEELNNFLENVVENLQNFLENGLPENP